MKKFMEMAKHLKGNLFSKLLLWTPTDTEWLWHTYYVNYSLIEVQGATCRTNGGDKLFTKLLKNNEKKVIVNIIELNNTRRVH